MYYIESHVEIRKEEQGNRTLEVTTAMNRERSRIQFVNWRVRIKKLSENLKDMRDSSPDI